MYTTQRCLTPATLGLCVVVLSGCFGCQRATAPSSNGQLLKLYGGAAALDTVLHATQVDAYRLDAHSYVEDTSSGANRMHGYQITAGPVKLVPTQARAFSRLLTTPVSEFFRDAHKACILQPGIGLRFTKAEHVIDILLCFSCDEFAIYEDGRSINTEDFDDVRPQLVKLAKQLYPNDKEIQALTDAK